MAMSNEQLMIELGLDASKVTKSISQLKTQLKSLENQRALAKTEADLDIVNRKIKIVEGEITRLKNIGFDNLEKSSKGARTAVTNLSLAVQDLPFGFVGIQNNLPGVIQGFGNLSSSSKNLGDLFKNLVLQLKGPAGIFLAFSVVTSIVTVLVQKYGSLSNAIDALLGKQNSLNSQIQKFNKDYNEFIKSQKLSIQVTNDATASQEGQIQVLQILTKRATDLTSSAESQKQALDELKRISKDYYDDLKIGKGNVDDIKKATEDYIKVLIAKARVQQYVNKIDDIETQIKEADRLAKQQEILVAAERKRNNEKKRTVGTSTDMSASIINEINQQDANRATLEKLYISLFDLNNQKQNFIDLAQQELSVITANTRTTDDGTKSIKEYFEAYKPTKEYIDFFKDISAKGKYDAGRKLFDELSNLDLTKGINSVKKFNEILGNIKDQFPGISQAIVTKPSELANAFLNLRDVLREQLRGMEQDIVDAEINKRLTTQFYDSYDFVKETLKNIREELKKTQKSFLDPIPASTENIIGLGPGSYEKVMAPVIKMQADMKKAREDFLRNFQDVSNILNDVFFQPLQDQFTNLIKNGKISLREFSNMVVENMKALAAKILATGIITLLGMIITGGFSAETMAATKLTGFQLFGKAFAGALGFGGTRSANLGGVGPGGLAMSGAVSLSLRGSDLVGAINRTNTNINRIG